jgi:archaemetzincin
MDSSILDATECFLRQFFGVGTGRLPPAGEPHAAYDPKRGQYAAVRILRDAAARRPVSASRLLAVTGKDLFIPMLSFVYGRAQLGGQVALVSMARLRQEFYGLPGNQPVLLARLRKAVLHELGHTFSLVHCLNRTCAMALAVNIRQLDGKRDEYCESCLILLGQTPWRLMHETALGNPGRR